MTNQLEPAVLDELDKLCRKITVAHDLDSEIQE